MKILVDGKDVYALSPEEIHKVYDELRLASRLAQQRRALAFRVGQIVSFESRRGMTVTGMILRINQRTITLSEIGKPLSKWKVSPSLLRLAETSKLKRTK